MKSKIFISAFIFCVIFCVFYGASFVEATTPRQWDPVVVSGEKLSALSGKSINNIRVYSFRDGKAAPIPFQIDERDEEGSLVFPLGPKPTSDTDNGLFDKNDELIFMSMDSGGKAEATSFPAGYSHVVEISVTDPLNASRSVVYALYYEKNPPERSAVDYVSISSDGSRVEARNFLMSFSDEAPIGFDSLAITPAGGGNGKNSVDSLKIRVKTVLRFMKVPINKSEADFESELVAFVDGPVRVVRRTLNRMVIFWKIATPNSVIDNVFYFNSFEFPTEIFVPFDIGLLASEFRFRISTDGNENQNGKIFINEHNPGGVVLDGKMTEKEQKLNISPYKWSVVYSNEEGNTGAWINRLDYDANLEAVPSLYYVDDIKAEEPPENIPGQFGAMGYDVGKMETVKKGIWRITSRMYNKPKYFSGDEKLFLNILDHPLQVETKSLKN